VQSLRSSRRCEGCARACEEAKAEWPAADGYAVMGEAPELVVEAERGSEECSRGM